MNSKQTKFTSFIYNLTLNEFYKEYHNEKFDFIISTLVLCSVENQKEVLKQIYDLLKPKGKFIFIEHIQAHYDIQKSLQNLISPVWKLFGDGCELNRPTLENIEELKFSSYDYQFIEFPFKINEPFDYLMGRVIVGSVQK
eukprot:TRINITY_DN1175_c1_g1_i3.p1 TRINITY_DN1175_c1_g1~~TRINITY_DN1175_c1_g1_i3.p1  ORF type:complete len:140 (+),score=41.80 TRINITY_DN1175_c1_g1_i3:306-725(+)